MSNQASAAPGNANTFPEFCQNFAVLMVQKPIKTETIQACYTGLSLIECFQGPRLQVDPSEGGKMSKNDVLLLWLNETVGKKNMQYLETMLTPDFRAKNAMSQDPFDKDELEEFILSLCNLVGPVTFSSEISIDQGDWVASRVVVHTSCLTTGKPINYRDHIFARFEGEKIAEAISLADYFTLFEHTGQLPVNALAACIGGQPLH